MMLAAEGHYFLGQAFLLPHEEGFRTTNTRKKGSEKMWFFSPLFMRAEITLR